MSFIKRGRYVQNLKWERKQFTKVGRAELFRFSGSSFNIFSFPFPGFRFTFIPGRLSPQRTYRPGQVVMARASSLYEGGGTRGPQSSVDHGNVVYPSAELANERWSNTMTPASVSVR